MVWRYHDKPGLSLRPIFRIMSTLSAWNVTSLARLTEPKPLFTPSSSAQNRIMHRIAAVPRIVLAQRQRLLASPAPPLLTRCYSSKIANKTFPPEAPDPEESFESQSMLASFKNMFDRGPNVGVEIITKQGFVLSNNVQVNQPLVLLNGSAFLWQPPKDVFQGNETESFKIFEVASPKPGWYNAMHPPSAPFSM